MRFTVAWCDFLTPKNIVWDTAPVCGPQGASSPSFPQPFAFSLSHALVLLPSSHKAFHITSAPSGTEQTSQHSERERAIAITDSLTSIMSDKNVKKNLHKTEPGYQLRPTLHVLVTYGHAWKHTRTLINTDPSNQLYNPTNTTSKRLIIRLPTQIHLRLSKKKGVPRGRQVVVLWATNVPLCVLAESTVKLYLSYMRWDKRAGCCEIIQ